MSNDSYSVPTLSLTGSRSRKSIPTKDVYQSRIYNIQTSNVSSEANFDKKQENRPKNLAENRPSSNYFNLPPKPKTYESYVPPMQKKEVKQISRNVYLSSQQQSHDYRNEIKKQLSEQNTATNNAIQRARQILGHSNSRGNLLKNPESRVQIDNEVKRQTNNMQFKKIDINKALFDRKMAKLFQQIDFYEEELQSLHSDSLVSQLQELQSMKQQSRSVHSKIIRDLNSLLT